MAATGGFLGLFDINLEISSLDDAKSHLDSYEESYTRVPVVYVLM